ncbi:MAG: hypothetical protein WC107_00295 [Patescibacteria group bacterium]
MQIRQKFKKKKTLFILGGGLLLLCLVAAGLYFYFSGIKADTAPGLTVIVRDQTGSNLITAGQVVVISANPDNIGVRRGIFYKLQEGYKCVKQANTFDYAHSLFYISYADTNCNAGYSFTNGEYYNPFTAAGQKNWSDLMLNPGVGTNLAFKIQKSLSSAGTVNFTEEELGVNLGRRPIAIYLQEDTTPNKKVAFKLLVNNTNGDWKTPSIIATTDAALDPNISRSSDTIFSYKPGQNMIETLNIALSNQIGQVRTFNSQNIAATEFARGETVTANISFFTPTQDYTISIDRSTEAQSAIHFNNINGSISTFNYYDNAVNSTSGKASSGRIQGSIKISATDTASNRIFVIKFQIPSNMTTGSHTLYGEVLGANFDAVNKWIAPATIIVK